MRLLNRLTEKGLAQDKEPFTSARHCLLTFAEELDHFRAALSFCEAYKAKVTDGDRDTLKFRFREFAGEYSHEHDENDPDQLREIAADLQHVGEGLGVATDAFTQDLYERAEEIETERAENEPLEEYDEDWSRPREPVENVHGMFDSLRNDLLDQ